MMHVYIIDDDPEIQRSMAFMLMSEDIGSTSFGSAEEFLQHLPQLTPGCLLLDLRMPGISGLALQAQLHQAGCQMPVIMMTGHGEVSSAVRAMKDGAIDFLEKPFSKSDLMAALKAAGRAGEQPVVTSHEQQKAEEQIAHLTNREREVLIGLVQGHLNKQIAYDLDISPRTVEVHRANVMKKLGVHSLSEMLQIAFLAGYSRLPDKAAG
ncbi:MAG: response regulator [Erythrobacter sp.]|jgi:two-component system response regulator FixJ|uniref:response regulator transcription factor n=1 Tax=Erythrobacter sp. TaxID=1042 RepID=UPI002B466FE8|nr:response regulator [Erythrobacter sp.]WRH70726.1 MAG: response regulator [Erythrobacter sp.]